MKIFYLLPLFVLCLLSCQQNESKKPETQKAKSGNVIYFLEAGLMSKIEGNEKLVIKKVEYQENTLKYYQDLKKSPGTILQMVDTDGKVKLGMTLNKDVIEVVKNSTSDDCGFSCSNYLDCENAYCFLSKDCVCSCECIDDVITSGIFPEKLF